MNVERIVLRGHPLRADRTDRPVIATGREAQVSVQHAVAAALVFGAAGVDQFTDACARDPDVIELRAKVEVIRDPSIATIAAEVDLFTSDGKKHALATKSARGSPSNPLSDEEIEAKLRTAALGRIADQQKQSLIDGVWALEKNTDVAALVALAVPR
jgi:2-methylcitrate dehydratase PrpD